MLPEFILRISSYNDLSSAIRRLPVLLVRWRSARRLFLSRYLSDLLCYHARLLDIPSL